MQVYGALRELANKRIRCNLKQCHSLGKGQVIDKQHELVQARAGRENQKDNSKATAWYRLVQKYSSYFTTSKWSENP